VTAVDPGPVEVERVMEDLVYEHLIDLVDFDRMVSLEAILFHQLERLQDKGQLGPPDPALAQRAAAIFARAWNRVLEDPRRYVDLRGRWEPDDDCEICRAIAAAEATQREVAS
jgi:hypothetical protein